jgi:hypothetical protein
MRGLLFLASVLVGSSCRMILPAPPPVPGHETGRPLPTAGSPHPAPAHARRSSAKASTLKGRRISSCRHQEEVRSTQEHRR